MRLRWGRLLLGLTMVGALAAGGVAWWLEQPLPLAADAVEVSIEPGSAPRQVAQAWVDAGVEVPAWALYEWFRWSGDARRIRAGSYEESGFPTTRRMNRARRSRWR